VHRKTLNPVFNETFVFKVKKKFNFRWRLIDKFFFTNENDLYILRI
jgi:Ca2+-dependent lipid-binding protein